jgi:phenylpropionate dioxygenase-like ring-hydroxylating dioxygenase large terminal subunit
MKETQILTRVGPGTPTGELFRQYWIPVAMSRELAAGGGPLRIKLLGEELIAFRSPGGRVGLMENRCPHRCASLFYGRNEAEGLRCVYHGWKFAHDGRCLDTPNLPPHQGVADKVRIKAYPTEDRAGVVWAYMGQRAVPPPFPKLPIFDVPPDRISVWCMQRECNYLQALEGDLDTSHAGFLHTGYTPRDLPADAPETIGFVNRTPEFKVADRAYGVMAGAYRPAEPGKTYWRFTQFMFPFFSQVPPCPLGAEAILRAWVPMDDTHTMYFSITTDTFSIARHPRATKRPIPQPGLTYDYDFLPNTTDWHGRWRLKANRANDHLIDRDVQRTESFSGIEGLDVQDTAITESMGSVVDHDNEMLVASDVLVARMRRRLLDAANAFAANGTSPPGLDAPEAYADVWSGYAVAPAETDWLEVYARTVRETPLAVFERETA